MRARDFCRWISENVEIGGDGLKFSLGGAIVNTDFLILLMLLGYRISPH